MKIVDKKILFGFLIGIFFMSGIGVLALNYMYNANQVVYGNNRLDETLNEIYDKVNDMKIVTLVADIGHVTITSSSQPSYTYSIKELSQRYSDLTDDDFIISMNGSYSITNYNSWADVICSMSKSYNSETGILTISTSYSQANSGGYSGRLSNVKIYMIA